MTPEGEADSHAPLPSSSGRHVGRLLPSVPLGKEDARNDKILGSTIRKSGLAFTRFPFAFVQGGGGGKNTYF